MSYEVLEEKIKTMPEQYISEVSQYVDFLMFKNSQSTKPIERRPLGFLKDAKVNFADDFAITAEELINLK